MVWHIAVLVLQIPLMNLIIVANAPKQNGGYSGLKTNKSPISLLFKISGAF